MEMAKTASAAVRLNEVCLSIGKSDSTTPHCSVNRRIRLNSFCSMRPRPWPVRGNVRVAFPLTTLLAQLEGVYLLSFAGFR